MDENTNSGYVGIGLGIMCTSMDENTNGGYVGIGLGVLPTSMERKGERGPYIRNGPRGPPYVAKWKKISPNHNVSDVVNPGMVSEASEFEFAQNSH